MDTIEKTDFLKSLKGSYKDPEKIKLIDAIIDEVEEAFSGILQRGRLFTGMTWFPWIRI